MAIPISIIIVKSISVSRFVEVFKFIKVFGIGAAQSKPSISAPPDDVP